MVAKGACYLAFTLTPGLFRLFLAYWISASLLASTGLLSCPLVEASAGTTAGTSATPRDTAGTGNANAGRVQLNATGSGLRSGEFLPIVDGPGPLVCPQSLTTQQGLGHCIGIHPLGSAMLNEDALGADIFLHCGAQMKPPQGASLLYRYPFLKRELQGGVGVPVFGKPVALPDWSAKFPSLVPKAVWQLGNRGTVFAAAFSSDYMHLLTLKNGTHWEHVNSTHFDSPGWKGLGSVAVSRLPNGGWRVASDFYTGESQRAHSLIDGHKGWRSPTYQPFGGDGIYRGSLPVKGVKSFDIDPRFGNASNFRELTPAAWSGGLLGLALTTMRYRGEEILLGSSHGGLVYIIPSSNATQPTPAVDASTEQLFKASVIGAMPIRYPRDEDNDDVIIGGENGLHFVSSEPHNAFSGENNQQLQLRLRHRGPVLEQLTRSSTPLATGSTPTVSSGDWDDDGVLDLIVGSAEGRIFFVKGLAASFNNITESATTSVAGLEMGAQLPRSAQVGIKPSTMIGFARPVALRTGTGADTAEILVQGGYRVDLQGPAESRWGYTAPTIVDWNGDGLMDLISSDNSARTLLYLRYRASGNSACNDKIPNGTSEVSSQLALRPAVPLVLDGLMLHGTWRNGPAAGKIGGRMAIVTSDEQDEMHVYYRIDNVNIRDGGKLLVRQPGSFALTNVQTNYMHAGGSGRLKYAIVDFDRDGLEDLLLGTCGYHSIGSNTSGLPACATAGAGGKCGNNGATALIMRQSNSSYHKTGQLVFEWPEWITVDGYRVAHGGQELGIAPIDTGNGAVSLILATPGGRHIFWDSTDIRTSTTEPPMQPPPTL